MLIKFNDACEFFGVTRDGLRKLQLRNSDFPQAMKFGDYKQAPVYFNKEEIEAWVESKKLPRKEVTA